MKIKKRLQNKKGLEMTFSWIFAILAGGFILFLAIYGASKLIRTGEQTVYTETAASLSSLFDPLETGLASGKASEIAFKKESKIYFTCQELYEPFGRHTLSFTEKTFGDEYGEKGQEISVKDKYIFSENVIEGKKFYYFTKPFFMSYKVNDLLMMYSDHQIYCMYDAPEDVVDTIEGLNLKNIYFPNSTTQCDGIDVCFKKGNCDISVTKDYVLKNGKKMYYKEDLLYAALFSSPEMYECNIQRIKKRFDSLGTIYLDKIGILERKNCQPTVGPELALAINTRIQSSKDLALLFDQIEIIDSINQRAKDGCKLFYNN